MQLHWQRNESDNSIISVDDQGIRVQDRFYLTSLLLSKDSIVDDWPVRTITDLTIESLTHLLEQQPDVLLLGTGKTQLFPDMQLFQTIIEQGVGLEVMTTEAACRTFNVLLSEHRNVVAALIQ